MVRVAGKAGALDSLKEKFRRSVLLVGGTVLTVGGFYLFFTARVEPDQYGVEQVRFGLKTGIGDRVFGPGLDFVGPGTTMQTFPREIHVLEASYDREDSRRKARGERAQRAVDEYFEQRADTLGKDTHRVIDGLNIQTSDGYAVTADVTLLYTITDPVRIAREFGWGSLYVDAFVINTFRNGVLATLGKMNAESFYDEQVRIAALSDAESFLKERLKERGFQVERLLLRNYRYVDTYEKSLHDKKVAVQMAVKNRKESLVNEEKAKLRQIESKGNATITIAESEVRAQIAKVKAEADLYSSQTRARADQEVNIATAEAKRLKAEALTQAGGRYVVALETAKMFANIEGAVMTPEQYISFIKNAWGVIGVSATGAGPPTAGGRQ